MRNRVTPRALPWLGLVAVLLWVGIHSEIRRRSIAPAVTLEVVETSLTNGIPWVTLELGNPSRGGLGLVVTDNRIPLLWLETWDETGNYEGRRQITGIDPSTPMRVTVLDPQENWRFAIQPMTGKSRQIAQVCFEQRMEVTLIDRVVWGIHRIFPRFNHKKERSDGLHWAAVELQAED